MRKIVYFPIMLILIASLIGCSNSNKINSVSNPIPQNTTNSTSKGSINSASNNKTIPFKYFYAGFVLQDNNNLPIGNNKFPIGTIVISTNKEWEDFKSKYLAYKNGDIAYIDMAYRFDKPADFDKESIIYNSILSAKQDVYSYAYQVDKIEIQDNKPNVIMKDLDNFNISTMNYNGVDERYIILLTVNKSDLPK